jgi:hypothetical protein
LRPAGHHHRVEPRRLFPRQQDEAQDRDVCDRDRSHQGLRRRPLRRYTTDASGLAGERLRLAQVNDHIILPEIISRSRSDRPCATATTSGSTS